MTKTALLGRQELLSSTFNTVMHDCSLAPYTTWNIGGEAEMLLEPESVDQVLAIYRYALKTHIPITILGRGSNTLIDDAGIPGLVVCLRNSLDDVRVDEEQGTVHAQAGCPLPKLAVQAGKAGLTGFEFLIGIPGTVGAGIAINAGIKSTVDLSIGERLESVRALDLATGQVEDLSASELGLGHRYSDILHKKWILEATFRAQAFDEVASIKARQKDALKKRAAKQPLQRYTCGSVFKQPAGGKAAGWYLDQLGLKGHRVGDALISPTHANWIENDGAATSADVRELMAFMQASVREHFGVTLEREVRFLPQDAFSPHYKNV